MPKFLLSYLYLYLFNIYTYFILILPISPIIPVLPLLVSLTIAVETRYTITIPPIVEKAAAVAPVRLFKSSKFSKSRNKSIRPSRSLKTTKASKLVTI